MASDVLEEETLSDEQIEALIQEAEGRARAKHSAVLLTESEDVLTLDEPTTEPSKRKPIPRLEPGIEVKNYIQERDGVARVRPELVADETQQRLADQLRLVSTKSSKKEVGIVLALIQFHEEKIPISLKQGSSPFRAVLPP